MIEKLSLRRLRYALRVDPKEGQYLKAFGIPIGYTHVDSQLLKGLPKQKALNALHRNKIGTTARYKRYFIDKGKVWKGEGVMQTKAPRGPDPRRKFSIDYDVNPIISTKALKVIAAAGGTVAAAIGALGAKAFKNKKEEKGVE